MCIRDRSSTSWNRAAPRCENRGAARPLWDLAGRELGCMASVTVSISVSTSSLEGLHELCNAQQTRCQLQKSYAARGLRVRAGILIRLAPSAGDS
eukprot:2589100-Prymnesium_polylepis.1